MNIEQLERILDHIERIEDVANEYNLGMAIISEDLESLRSTVENALMLLVYEKYKEEKT
ncbi:hypothetical protein ES703_06903 [subsurface metagenome]